MSINLYDELMNATSHLAAATSAYEEFVGRHGRRGRKDPVFSTRINDFTKAVERARAALHNHGPGPEEGVTTEAEIELNALTAWNAGIANPPDTVHKLYLRGFKDGYRNKESGR